MDNLFKTSMDTPLGSLNIIGDDHGIHSIMFNDEAETSLNEQHIIAQKAKSQLEEYFRKDRTVFDLPIVFSGTEFQHKVWLQLLGIKYGYTTSYQKIANALKNPKSIRAVGTTNGKNKHTIVVPCHRVIGSDGSLTGYASGLWRKKWLLEFERGEKQTSLF